MADLLLQLQRWFSAQCDGDWEHGCGVRIETLDNPGWGVNIDLAGTALAGRPFAPIEHGLDSDATTDWLHVVVRDECFKGRGDPAKLAVILRTFLAWAEASSPSGPAGRR